MTPMAPAHKHSQLGSVPSDQDESRGVSGTHGAAHMLWHKGGIGFDVAERVVCYSPSIGADRGTVKACRHVS